MSGRKDKRQQDLCWVGSGHENPGSDAGVQGSRPETGCKPRLLASPRPKFGGGCLGLGAPLAAAPGLGRSAQGNCSDRPSQGPRSPPPPHDRYSITGACISPAHSLQVPTSNPFPCLILILFD